MVRRSPMRHKSDGFSRQGVRRDLAPYRPVGSVAHGGGLTGAERRAASAEGKLCANNRATVGERPGTARRLGLAVPSSWDPSPRGRPNRPRSGGGAQCRVSAAPIWGLWVDMNHRARRAPVPPTPERLHARAMRYLERFATTSAHLRRVLLRRAMRDAAPWSST